MRNSYRRISCNYVIVPHEQSLSSNIRSSLLIHESFVASLASHLLISHLSWPLFWHSTVLNSFCSSSKLFPTKMQLLKCFICRNATQTDAEGFKKLRKTLLGDFRIFCKYLLPGITPRINLPQPCSSCYSSFVVQVYEFHLRLKELQARNASLSAKLCQVLQNSMEKIQSVGEQSNDRLTESGDSPTIASSNALVLTPEPIESKHESQGSVDSTRPEYRQGHLPPLGFEEAAGTQLDYSGIPNRKFSSRSGYKCEACDLPIVKRSETFFLHMRQVHLGEQVAARPRTVYRKKYTEDETTSKIRYLGNYFCTRLADGSFKCDSCNYVTPGPLRVVLGHLRMKHASKLWQIGVNNMLSLYGDSLYGRVTN